MTFKEEHQQQEIFFLLGAVIFSLSIFLYGCYDKNEQDIKDIHGYYDCVFEKMTEGKDEYEAKEQCAEYERDKQEASDEYYENMRP